MMTEVKQVKKIEPYNQRTVITIPLKQFKRLLKTGRCHTVKNYHWYELVKEQDPRDIQLFDKAGKKISINELARLLRKVK